MVFLDILNSCSNAQTTFTCQCRLHYNLYYIPCCKFIVFLISMHAFFTIHIQYNRSSICCIKLTLFYDRANLFVSIYVFLNSLLDKENVDMNVVLHHTYRSRHIMQSRSMLCMHAYFRNLKTHKITRLIKVMGVIACTND